MFTAPHFTDTELTRLGVPPRPNGATRTERRTVRATADAINRAPGHRRVRRLRALFGTELMRALQQATAAAGIPLGALRARIPTGSCAPDLVVGYDSLDARGEATFVVIAICEFKRAGADNVHQVVTKIGGSWSASVTGNGTRTREVELAHQCDGYRGAASRWLDRQAGPRWQLPAGGVDAALWVLICEFDRADAPAGWNVRPWAPLVADALRDVRRRRPGAAEAGGLLREWVAPHAERLFYAGRPAPFGSLRAAAVAAYNDGHPRLIHRDRDTTLLAGPTGGWRVVDADDRELPATHPDVRAWAAEVTAAGELLASQACPSCTTPTGDVTAQECGHIDVDGFRFPGVTGSKAVAA